MYKSHRGTDANDGALLSNCLARLLPYYIQEIKNELSAGGAEPSFEAILYHLEYVRPIVLNPNKSLSISEKREGVPYIAPKFSFDTTTLIMIREGYEELWQQILLYLTENCSGNVNVSGMVIIGQPGIGK